MGKWGVSIQMPPHKIRRPHTRPDDRSADAERSVSAVHPRIVRREDTESVQDSRPAVRKTSRVIQVLLSSASTTMRFTSALDISREKPQFACHCFSIVRRRFSTRRMRSARVCSAFCKDRQLRTDQRSVWHVPDFHHAVCRFCLHPADRFLLCFPFFFCTPFYSQVVIYRAASKSRILEVFFCAIMV